MLTPLPRILRVAIVLCVLLAPLAPSACSRGPRLPSAIDFDGEHLTKASSWAQGAMTAVVWTRPGETLPTARLQVGAIVSNAHQTAKDLNLWISQHAGQRYYDSNGLEDACRVGTTELPDQSTRVYMTVVTCQTGVDRAACVEADETLPQEDFTSCLQNDRCFAAICDLRWVKRRDALDRLAAAMLSTR